MAAGRSNKCRSCVCEANRANYYAHHQDRLAYFRERDKTPERRELAAMYQRKRRERRATHTGPSCPCSAPPGSPLPGRGL
jgi:hypothetical protein